MAASLGQEFCTLRDTYIEKQFGRLNDICLLYTLTLPTKRIV